MPDGAVQFSHFYPENSKEYHRPFIKSLNEEELSNFIYDDFDTIDGSNHSVSNCGCEVISEAYAKWFLENDIPKLFKQFKEDDNAFKLYEDAVKSLCKRENIKFEGV